MTREPLHEMAGRIVSVELAAAVAFFSFLLGVVAQDDEAGRALERLKKHEYDQGDSWEADVRMAEGRLHLLIELLPQQDVRTAGRFLEYLLGAGEGDRNTERVKIRGGREIREVLPVPACVQSRGCSATCNICGSGEGELHMPRKLRGIFCAAHCPVCGGKPVPEGE